jgi:CheY-like chemotaxis protein
MARILVVDDEEPVRALLKRLLALHGHAVDTAEDGAQAVDQVQKKSYDLLIIDRHMPNMSGVDAVAILRTSPRFKSLKILMATQDSVIGSVDQAFEAGVDGYVVKPFDMKKLLAKVDRTLAG